MKKSAAGWFGLWVTCSIFVMLVAIVLGAVIKAALWFDGYELPWMRSITGGFWVAMFLVTVAGLIGLLSNRAANRRKAREQAELEAEFARLAADPTITEIKEDER